MRRKDRQMEPWIRSRKVSIGTYRTIRHSASGELCLAGKCGEIYEYDQDHYRVALYSARFARRHIPGLRLRHDDEYVHTIPKAELDTWVARLRVPKTWPAQIRYASNR